MAPKIQETKPNVPSFDFDPETGKPVLAPGETIVAVDEVQGIPVYTTDGGKAIHVCSIDDYQAKIAGLYRAVVWEHYFPHAADKVKKFKLDKALLGATGKAMKVAAETGGGGGGIE